MKVGGEIGRYRRFKGRDHTKGASLFIAIATEPRRHNGPAPLEDMAPFLPREELKSWTIASCSLNQVVRFGVKE